MYKFGILGGALAALFIAGCGDKDPVPEGATWSMFTPEGKLLAQANAGSVGPLLSSDPAQGEAAELVVLK